MTTKEQVLQQLARLSSSERKDCLADEKIRNLVLSSGANVTLYCGKAHSGNTLKECLDEVYVGLIQRVNRHGYYDGLGALGGLAERTSYSFFENLTIEERKNLVGVKDDVILVDAKPILITDIDIIRQNNVLRELREELDDLGIQNVMIETPLLELIPMPHVRDDNYIINIWDGKGEAFAITPYCHLYQDNIGLIDEFVKNAKAKKGGEVATYKKVQLFDALKSYGHRGTSKCSLEDGRSAVKDYRYPHEYLAAWSLASKALKHSSKALVCLAKEVQAECAHPISFLRLAKDTGQNCADIASSLLVTEQTVMQMEQAVQQIRLDRARKSTGHGY